MLLTDWKLATHWFQVANAAPEVGNTSAMANIPVGTVIHNIEIRPGQGASLVRSAGAFAQLTSREGDYCVIKMPSGEKKNSWCL